MNAIVAVDENWAIGSNGRLLARIPHDMDTFIAHTIMCTVVMGRKTLESFPGGKPLKNRTNIVLTTDPNYDGNGAIVVHDLDELEEELKNYESEDIYVIGGGNVYSQLIDKCDTAYVTKIYKKFEDTDTWFPNLDDIKAWRITESTEVFEYEGLKYQFFTYSKA